MRPSNLSSLARAGADDSTLSSLPVAAGCAHRRGNCRCGNTTKRSDSQPQPSRLNFQSYSRLNARFSFSCARAVCLGLRRYCAYFLRCRSSGQRRSWVVCLRPRCALLSRASFGRLECSPSLVPQRSKSIQSVEDGRGKFRAAGALSGDRRFGSGRCIATMNLGWRCGRLYSRERLDNRVLVHRTRRHQP